MRTRPILRESSWDISSSVRNLEIEGTQRSIRCHRWYDNCAYCQQQHKTRRPASVQLTVGTARVLDREF